MKSENLTCWEGGGGFQTESAVSNLHAVSEALKIALFCHSIVVLDYSQRVSTYQA